MNPIPLARPFVGREELEELEKVLDSAHLTQGPVVQRLEQELRAVTGSAHTLAVSSGTTALHLALCALGVGPGDEVAVSDFTFPATANAIVQTGARPVFVDVLPDTFAMDAADLRRKLGPATRAVMVVDPFGVSADYDALRAVAGALPIVEDAACALGALYMGSAGERPAGALGDIACFSFHPRKSITTGEGGLVTTSDAELAARTGGLRNHGMRRGARFFEFVEPGFNYRMSDLAAAVGLAQLRKLEHIVATRRALAQALTARLAGLAQVSPQRAPAAMTHTYQSFVVVLDEAVDRDAVIDALSERGVQSTLGTYAVHAEPAFAARWPEQVGGCPRSLSLYRQSLTLPLFVGMTEHELDRVAEALGEALPRCQR